MATAACVTSLTAAPVVHSAAIADFGRQAPGRSRDDGAIGPKQRPTAREMGNASILKDGRVVFNLAGNKGGPPVANDRRPSSSRRRSCQHASTSCLRSMIQKSATGVNTLRKYGGFCRDSSPPGQLHQRHTAVNSSVVSPWFSCVRASPQAERPARRRRAKRCRSVASCQAAVPCRAPRE